MKLKTLNDYFGEIRDFVNRSLISDRFREDIKNWSQICSCMDMLEDTEMAISNYKTNSFGVNENTPKHEEISVGYITIFGILQALVVQQDALDNLFGGLKINVNKFKSIDLKNIRDIRVITSGHPTKVTQNKLSGYYHIAQYSVSKVGYELVTYQKDGNYDFKMKSISLYDLIDVQQRELIGIVKKLLSIIKRKEYMHKKKFNTKLVDILDGMHSYAMEKLYEFAHNETNEAMKITNAIWALEFTFKKLEEFRKALKEREIDITDANWTYYFEPLDFATNSLLNDFNYKKDAKSKKIRYNVTERYIISYFIDNQVKELIEMAKQIDEDYAVGKRRKSKKGIQKLKIEIVKNDKK